MQFATQGIAGPVVELVAQHWKNVGINTTVKEVTPGRVPLGPVVEPARRRHVGEGPAAGDRAGDQRALRAALRELLLPPQRHALGRVDRDATARRASSRRTGSRRRPSDINKFQSTPVGTPESDELGAKLVENMTGEPAVHRHRQRAEPDLSPQRAEERARVQDGVLRVLLDLSLPPGAVVLRRVIGLERRPGRARHASGPGHLPPGADPGIVPGRGQPADASVREFRR